MARSQHIGVLAGEKSGDILGGAVLRELKRRNSEPIATQERRKSDLTESYWKPRFGPSKGRI